MNSDGPNYFILAALIIFPIGMYLHARGVRAKNPGDEYFKLEGKKLKCRSATFDGNNYAFCIEYKIADDYLGVRCYLPSFHFVTKYSDITL